jgi:hypothetical protein
MVQLVNKAASGDFKSIKLVFEIAGPLSELGRQADLEKKHQQDSGARERVTKKLNEMAERLRAGQPLFPEDPKDTEE